MLAFGIGEAAALAAALSWAGSCQVHTMAGRIIGPVTVTVARIPLYLVGIGLVVYLSGANISMPPGALLFITASALFGITLSDPFLYAAAVSIGPRLSLLIQSLSACITAVLGFFFLGENLNVMGWIGIVTASFGVAFVLMEGGVKQGTDLSGLTRLQILRGAGMAFLSATCMALAFLVLKQAIILGLDPVWATFLRTSIGGAFLWLFTFLRGHMFATLKSVYSSWMVMRLLILACCVSTVGNCLAPVAIKYTEAGIVATLVGLQPVMIIGITAIVERKAPTLRAVIGTVIAFSGAAMIFLR